MTTLTDSEIVSIRIWAWEQLEGWGTKIKSPAEIEANSKFEIYTLRERMKKANDLANWLMSPYEPFVLAKEEGGTEITFSRDEVTTEEETH